MATDTSPLTAKHFLGLTVVCITIISSVFGAGWLLSKTINDSAEKSANAVHSLTEKVIEVKARVDSNGRSISSIDDTVDELEERSMKQSTIQTEQGKDLEYIKEKVRRAHP